jgi:glycosyltransferase involved in cell wall biosynthesis
VPVPVALTFHALGVTKRQWQGASDTSPRARIEEEARLARACDRLIATANHEVFDLVRMGANRRRISVVPCGVDLRRFRPGGAVTADPPRRHRFRLLCVSRLVERKGIDTAVDALPALPETELIVAGGPPRRDLGADAEARRLRARARALGVANRVVFTGQVAQQQLPELYRSADAVVCTPWYEPFGMVALEAMACGVPAVVSAVGGLVDTVIDGVTGVHVPARDAGALARALGGLLADDERRAAMGCRAAANARERYGWDTVAAETARAYVATTSRIDAGRRSVV